MFHKPPNEHHQRSTLKACSRRSNKRTNSIMCLFKAHLVCADVQFRCERLKVEVHISCFRFHCARSSHIRYIIGAMSKSKNTSTPKTVVWTHINTNKHRKTEQVRAKVHAHNSIPILYIVVVCLASSRRRRQRRQRRRQWRKRRVRPMRRTQKRNSIISNFNTMRTRCRNKYRFVSHHHQCHQLSLVALVRRHHPTPPRHMFRSCII